MNISLKKFLAGKPTGMMSRASVKALLDAAKSALLSDPRISDEIEALKLDALRVGQSHEVFNKAELAELPHASEIIAKAEACLAKDATRKARAVSQPKNTAKHYPVKAIATLPKVRKEAPPSKAAALNPVAVIKTITESGIVSHSQRGGRAAKQSQKSN
jgi:hypothetical protein